MSKAKEIGKFIYIEPNDLYGDKPSNAIPQPYEDYSMAVDLQVEIPSRDSCGDPNFKKVLYFSSDNGTISFFGGSGGGDGKQGYLTTNFTDVSPMNVGKGNKETLGISSINITYDSWFFPVVTINFVDVRGASLMMPQEYAYRTEISNNTRDITQIEGGSFFKSLFSFPYPLFKLTVKGFYGRAAVYNLAVKDFKATFNSQTGNFECVTQFIGYMFGVYTDIPMTYLAVAPYIDRGLNSKYGPSWLESDFWYHEEVNGVEQKSMKMMSFPEFKLAINTANSQLDKIVSSSKVALDMNEVRKKKMALNAIKDKFNSIGFTKLKDEKFVNGCFYYLLTDKKEDFELGKQIITLQQQVEEYVDANFSKNDSGSLKSTLNPLFDRVKRNDGKAYLNYSCEVEIDRSTREVIFPKNDYYNIINNSESNKKAFNEKVLGANKTLLYFISFVLVTDFNEYIENQDRQYEKKNRDFEIALQQERLNALENVLGFKPSIKNIFDMTFAHMETFVKEYYKMLDNIRDKTEKHLRKPQSFGFKEDKDTDFKIVGPDNPSNSTNPSDKQVPPFPLFIKEITEDDGTKINRVVGPWEFDDKNIEMDEMQFVIKLLNAGKFYSEEVTRINEEIEKSKDAQGSILPDVDKLIPVTLYDFANPSFNPYKSVEFVSGSENDKVYQIFLIFFLRWYYFSITLGKLLDGNGSTRKYFAQMEAFNLKKVFPKITEIVRSVLLKSNDLEKFISKEKERLKAFTKIGDSDIVNYDINSDIVKYEWLKSGDDIILPIGDFSIKAIKTDYQKRTYDNTNKYVKLSNRTGTFSESTKNNFVIQATDDLFEKTITAIKNADDGIGDSFKKSMEEALQEDSIFTKAQTKKEPYVYNIFTTGEVEKTYSFVQYLNKIKAIPSEDIEKLRLVGDGTSVNGEPKNSVFSNDIFNLQQTTLSKAYLFVMSLPLKTSIFADGEYIINNGTTLKSMLLREGAYYWRYDIMRNGGSDPINLIVDGKEAYKNAAYNEIYITNERKNNTLSFVKKGSNVKYLRFNEPKSINEGDFAITQGRRETIKQYFIDWASGNWSPSVSGSTFKEIEYYPKQAVQTGKTKDGKYYETSHYKSDPDYNRLMLDVLTDFESVIDEAPFVILKNGKTFPITNKAKYSYLKEAFKMFIDNLNDLYKDTSDDLAILTTEANLAQSTDVINDKDLMLSTYLILKSLYDKWFCGTARETWFLDNEKSDFKNFKYVDSYYNNIGHKLIPNMNNTLELINAYMPDGDPMTIQTSTEYSIKSMHEFLSENCEKIGVYFKSLPLMYGLDPTDVKKIETMFDAIPFSKYTNGEGLNDGQTYLCMYAYKPSEHLDIRDDYGQYDYADDSFDICDINGERSNTLPASLYEVGKNSIPAFGVTYVKQNQSYFKNISVSMENPMQTEASIATTIALASKAGDEPRNITLYGQDLYRVYSNYSYTCSVDMMGNSQVVPMMYFQLNNIPMFRGAYMITKVEHNITAGNMTTKFTGVRQNKNAAPLIVGAAILFDKEGNPLNKEYELIEGEPYEVVVPEGTYDCDVAVSFMHKPHSYESAHNIAGGENRNPYGYCAEWVKFYAGNAGATYFKNNSVGNAWLMRENHHIENAEFKCVDVWRGSELKEIVGGDIEKARKKLVEWSRYGRPGGQKAERGDIIIMRHGTSGHVCMWNDLDKDIYGKYGIWVSDFVQDNGPWCYETEYPTELYLYRWKGTRKLEL